MTQSLFIARDGVAQTMDRPPNESRLSCGAKLKCSQMEFYYAVIQEVHQMLWGRAPPASSAC